MDDALIKVASATVAPKSIKIDWMSPRDEIKKHGYKEVTSTLLFRANSSDPDPEGL